MGMISKEIKLACKLELYNDNWIYLKMDGPLISFVTIDNVQINQPLSAIVLDVYEEKKPIEKHPVDLSNENPLGT
jgi:hypothetical protein